MKNLSLSFMIWECKEREDYNESVMGWYKEKRGRQRRNEEAYMENRERKVGKPATGLFSRAWKRQLQGPQKRIITRLAFKVNSTTLPFKLNQKQRVWITPPKWKHFLVIQTPYNNILNVTLLQCYNTLDHFVLWNKTYILSRLEYKLNVMLLKFFFAVITRLAC